jgi:fluoroquinolone transport system permease protein
MRFQFRHGFYYVYGILSVVYILILHLLPLSYRYPALTYILFTDVCALGFTFIGALVLLEKGQNITQSLFVTPIRLTEYLLSKQISFLALTLLSTIIIITGAGLWGERFGWFGLGVLLSAPVYTIFGLVFAAKARHVNDYFVRVLGIGLLISAPVLSYAQLIDTPLFYLLPTRATLILLDIMRQDYSPGEITYAVVCLIVWLLITWRWAWLRFEKHVRHPA